MTNSGKKSSSGRKKASTGNRGTWLNSDSLFFNKWVVSSKEKIKTKRRKKIKRAKKSPFSLGNISLNLLLRLLNLMKYMTECQKTEVKSYKFSANM